MSVLQATIPFKPRKKVSGLVKKNKSDTENEDGYYPLATKKNMLKRHLKEDNTGAYEGICYSLSYNTIFFRSLGT